MSDGKIEPGSGHAKLAEAMAEILQTTAGKELRRQLDFEITRDFSVDEATGAPVSSEELWRRVGYRQMAISLLQAGDVDIRNIRGRE